MSCIELYPGDLCHFHLPSIENIADFVTCSSILPYALCGVRACVCLCVIGDRGGQIHFKIKQIGRGGGGGGGWRT